MKNNEIKTRRFEGLGGTEFSDIIRNARKNKDILIDTVKNELILASDLKENTDTDEIEWNNGIYYNYKYNMKWLDELIYDLLFDDYTIENIEDTATETIEKLLNGYLQHELQGTNQKVIKNIKRNIIEKLIEKLEE